MKLIKVVVCGLLSSLTKFEVVSANPEHGIFENMINSNDGELLLEHVNIMNDGSFNGVIDDTEENIKNFLSKNPLLVVSNIEEVIRPNVSFDFG